MATTERKLYLDVARGAGIILVVIGHMNIPKSLINLIYIYHMPLFYYVSGAVFKEYSLRRELKLLNSYLFYGLFFVCLGWPFCAFQPWSKLGALVSFAPKAIWSIHYFGVMWFALALLAVRALANYLRPNYVVCLLLFFTVEFLARMFPMLINLPFAMLQAILVLFFYQLGRGHVLERFADFKGLVASALALGGVIVVELLLFNGAVEKVVNYHNCLLFNPALALAGALAGILLTLDCARRLPQKSCVTKFFSFLGKNSFVIFVWHYLVLAASRKIFRFDSLYISLAIQLMSVLLFCFLYSRVRPLLPRCLARYVYL
jgi:fucose 4-O-acetylase-like acetyltransferase